MKTNVFRIVIPLAIVVIAGIGFIVNLGTGTLSAFGWSDIALLCPLGALGTMIAEKALIPRALVALGIAMVLILVFGRAFCGWICPVPVVKRIPNLFKSKKQREAEQLPEPTAVRLGSAHPCTKSQCAECGHCDGCADVRAKVDSRHFVLLGGLLSAAIFGFPVFCLICPIGLTFATVFLVIALFGAGDITWSLIAVPVLLAVEVIFFRKWCSRICPLSALMSLLGLANSKTLRPSVDTEKCLETHGGSCGRCAAACEVKIDPRHPELGAGWNECLKCHACVEACPSGAITMPFLPKKSTPAVGPAAPEPLAAKAMPADDPRVPAEPVDAQ